jgi:hypothetical protein
MCLMIEMVNGIRMMPRTAEIEIASLTRCIVRTRVTSTSPTTTSAGWQPSNVPQGPTAVAM